MQTIALNVASAIFLIMSVLQLLRVIFRVKVIINDRIVIPIGLSMITSPVMFLLSLYMFISARS